MLKYKTFETSEDFEKWQESEKPIIMQVSPLLTGISVEETNRDSIHTYADGSINAGVFVVYKEKE